jgi:DNA-binding IclR family transcriptional regulator
MNQVLIEESAWKHSQAAGENMPKELEVRSQRRRPKWAVADNSKPEPADEQYYSRTIARALDVLEAFTEEQDTLTLKELGRAVKLPESSLFRVLLTLQTRGYLIQSADGAYQLSRKVLFGKLLERAEALRDLARKEMQSLASRFNETISLAYLFGERIQVLEAFETFHEIRVTNRPGRVLPPHCSAMGKAITAFQDLPVIDRILEVYGLASRTPKTIIDRRALLEEFEGTRKSGYAFDREESTIGGICVGAPIRSKGGNVVAAISVSTPIIRMTPDREKEIVKAILHSAQEISNKQRK